MIKKISIADTQEAKHKLIIYNIEKQANNPQNIFYFPRPITGVFHVNNSGKIFMNPEIDDKLEYNFSIINTNEIITQPKKLAKYRFKCTLINTFSDIFKMIDKQTPENWVGRGGNYDFPLILFSLGVNRFVSG